MKRGTSIILILLLKHENIWEALMTDYMRYPVQILRIAFQSEAASHLGLIYLQNVTVNLKHVSALFLPSCLSSVCWEEMLLPACCFTSYLSFRPSSCFCLLLSIVRSSSFISLLLFFTSVFKVQSSVSLRSPSSFLFIFLSSPDILIALWIEPITYFRPLLCQLLSLHSCSSFIYFPYLFCQDSLIGPRTESFTCL